MKKFAVIIAAAAVVAGITATIILGSQTSADGEERSMLPRIATGYEVLTGRYYLHGDTTKPYIQMNENTYKLICDDYEAFKEESIIAMGAQNADQNTLDIAFASLTDECAYVPVEVGYTDGDFYTAYLGYGPYEDSIPGSGYNFYPDDERPAFGKFGIIFYYVPESEWAESAE